MDLEGKLTERYSFYGADIEDQNNQDQNRRPPQLREDEKVETGARLQSALGVLSPAGRDVRYDAIAEIQQVFGERCREVFWRREGGGE